MGLKDIKGKIRSVDRTHKVTKAMEAVSAVKMRHSQERALSGRPYAASAVRILSNVLAQPERVEHPLISEHTSGKECLVVITSDKGLAGSFNAAVLREVRQVIAQEGLGAENLCAIAIGKKAIEFFERRHIPCIHTAANVQDAVSLADMEAVREVLTSAYAAADISRVQFLYTQFVSTFEHRVKTHTILPVSVADVRETVGEIIPERGKYAELRGGEDRDVAGAYTFEPSAEAVLDAIIPHVISVMLYHGLLESKAAEHSARMIAMKNASDKAEEVSHDLTLAFNKARQAQITSEVSEITGGIEAMADYGG